MAVTVEINGNDVTFDLSVNGGEVQLNVIKVDGNEIFGGDILWIDRSGKLNRFVDSGGVGLSVNDRGAIKKGGGF